MSTSATTSAPLIEKHTIGYVPPEDRHGKVRDLFTLWFGGNIAPLPIVTGALGVQLFHLNLVWGIVAILVGHLVGGVLMALHSAQGPQMGIPQMIQYRSASSLAQSVRESSASLATALSMYSTASAPGCWGSASLSVSATSLPTFKPMISSLAAASTCPAGWPLCRWRRCGRSRLRLTCLIIRVTCRRT